MKLSELNPQTESAQDASKKLRRAKCLYFLFQNHIAFQDFFMPIGMGKLFLTRYSQYGFTLAETGVVFGGRSAGKSLLTNARMIRTATSEPNTESLITSLRRTHIKDRLEEVISYLLVTPYLRAFLKGEADHTTKGSIVRTPIYSIKFKNGHQITGISSGDDPNGIMIQGHHPSIRFCEETSFILMAAWKKFQETADPRGTKDWFIGTVDGRVDTPYRQMDGKIEKYRRHRFHVSRRMDPYWTQALKRERSEALGGEESSEFKNQIDAEWGDPITGLWSEQDLRNCFDPEGLREHGRYVREMEIISVSSKDYCPKSPEDRGVDLQMLFSELEPVSADADVILAVDAGYAQPTMILPFVHNKESLRWELKKRTQLVDRMLLDHQADCIDYIAEFYRAKWIPIDATGGEGKALCGALVNATRVEFEGKDYRNRVLWVEFQKKMAASWKYHESKNQWEIVEEFIKNQTTVILRQMFSRREFLLFFDDGLIMEFLAEGKREPKSGNRSIIIVTPSWCHIPEAFRLFAYAHQLKFSPLKQQETEEPDEYDDSMMPEWGSTGITIFGRT